jgi:xanthine dehydrogenase small subunit
MRASVDFILNGAPVSLAGEDPTRTVLAWLREARGLVGTKEGCAEGDCGACTVVLGERGPGGELRYVPVNSCIQCLGTLDGKELITVEGLKPLYDGALHPVQQAMVDCHGSQCGFCTPGFVMALYAHYKNGSSPKRAALCDAIAGNLCRCTGYRPILEAGERARTLTAPERERAEDEARRSRLGALLQDSTFLQITEKKFFVPTTVEELAAFLVQHPEATILAGGTDLGLLLTKAHRDFHVVAYTGRVAELKTVREEKDAVEVGGAVTYADAHAALAAIHPDFGELIRRLGAAQIRAAGTLAGNVANGSPIGDSMPPLLALDASVFLQRGKNIREVRLADFYTGYRKTALQPGEFIRAIRVPKLAPGAKFACYKLSRRFDQDISTLCAAFHVDVKGGAHFAFGGMAATPARAKTAERAYASGVEAACEALAIDFQPLDDHRGSAWYRLAAAQNLVRKFHLESTRSEKTATRVLEAGA